MNLSAIIITLNEEYHIAACINHLRAIECEIIVVDSGSVDRTIEIAESLGVTVIKHKWQGYSYARNLGAKYASYPWILSIDADEYISDQLAYSIKNIDTSDPQIIYAINRLNYIGENPVYHSGWYPDYVPRIYHKEKTKWIGDYVHENLRTNNMVIHRLNGIMDHFSYRDRADHQEKMKKYAKLSAQEMHHKGISYNIVMMWIKSLFRWFRTYVIKRGFLDGELGLYISNSNAKLIRMRYAELKKLEAKQKAD